MRSNASVVATVFAHDLAVARGFYEAYTCVQSATFKRAQNGILKLGLSSSNRDGYIFVPSQYDPANANAMILAIHAAGRGGLDALQLLIASANSSGRTPELLQYTPGISYCALLQLPL